MLELDLKNFDIDQIAESGQCFRMYRLEKNTWEIFALNEFLKIQKKFIGNKTIHIFYCSQKKFDSFWFNYFDLQTNYENYIHRILKTNDEYLKQAVIFGSGLRILNQDLWEMIVSFVISQQNNITRIKNCLKNLCDINEGKFPSPEDFLNLKKEDLASVKLGYRESYLSKISEDIVNKNFDLKKLKKMNYDDAFKYLKNLHGVGDKVANCITLFGLHKIESFPIDVWIKKIIEQRYQNNFSLENFHLEAIGGIVQQYMYFYERNLAKKNVD